MIRTSFSLLLFFIFLFSCSPLNPKGPKLSKEEKRADVRAERNDLEEPEVKAQERDRLKSNRISEIDSFLEDRYIGSSSYTDYSGEDCEENRDCKEICDHYFRSNRSRCYNQPEDLVRELRDGLFELINISEADQVEVSPGLFYGILDIDSDLIEDLIEDNMSEGDIKSFLTWVALNEDISKVLEKRDRGNKILTKAFEELGKLQSGSRDNLRLGLNTGLIGTDDTFLFIASDERNETGFKLAYDLVEDECGDKNCKMEIFCARELQSSGRVRVGRSFGTLTNCRTPESSRRRSSRRKSLCYIHGGDVWSYIYELIEDDEINDRDLEGDVLSVDKCNSFCGDKNSNKCKAII